MKHLIMIALLLMASSVSANDPEIYSHSKSGAIKGYDVVAYFNLPPDAKAVKGSDEFTYEWKGATWKFSSDQNRQRFIKDPETYAPQYGGYCAFAVSHGFTTSPRPHSWSIVDGKLYLNNNKRSHERWKEDYENKIAKGDANWPEVLKD